MLAIITFLLLTSIFFGYFCIRFALIIINMQDKIESALDKIDTKYNRLSQILEIPVFYNSPEIKNIIIEVQEVQDVVLSLAKDLTDSTQVDKKNDGDQIGEEKN